MIPEEPAGCALHQICMLLHLCSTVQQYCRRARHLLAHVLHRACSICSMAALEKQQKEGKKYSLEVSDSQLA